MSFLNNKFIKRNIVAVVMIPVIIGFHFGWGLLQHNRNLVPEGTEVEQPLVSIYKKITSDTNSSDSQT